MLKIVMLLFAVLLAGCANEEPAQPAADAAPAPAAAPPETADAPPATTDVPPTDAGVQQVNLRISGGDYHPASISVRPGAPIRLTVTRDDKPTCGETLVIPAANIKQEIPANQAVTVDLPAQQSGKLAFTCGMNMMKGSIVVE